MHQARWMRWWMMLAIGAVLTVPGGMVMAQSTGYGSAPPPRTHSGQRYSSRRHAEQGRFIGKSPRRWPQGWRHVRGRVLHVGRVEIKNLPTEHVLVVVRTQSERLRLVDLGPVRGLMMRLRVHRGDELLAVGDIRMKSGRWVLIADRAWINGRFLNVRRNRRREWRRIQWAIQMREQRQGRGRRR